MANLNKLFIKFSDNITITDAKRESLKTSRDALRKDIKEWFEINGKERPFFYGQGSYAMKTLINPLGENEYDIDDGVYIEGFKDRPSSEWPVPDTVHKWIKNAVEERTSSGAIDKDTCIRVTYAKGYHIDLPAYICSNDKAYLAHKSKGWCISDPKAFTHWFVKRVDNEREYGEQLRRIVKYIKAWRDYKNNPLKGVEITILASMAFEKYEGRDDKSLKCTVDNIVSNLKQRFMCEKPVEPFEDLFDDCSDNRKSLILNGLNGLARTIEQAIDKRNERVATEILRDKVFGSRFPLGEEVETEEYAVSPAPGVLRSDGRSAYDN